MYNQIIIVGAPRSGTNMLRNVMTALPGYATWPCDEINLVWKHGNARETSDELTPAHATPHVRQYLHRQFHKVARRYRAHTVVEKTCATSLRVGFAAKVFPDAKFLFIRRDGLDAAVSASQRWHARLDWPYTVRKARYAPPSDLARYGLNALGRRISNSVLTGRPSGAGPMRHWWGPRPIDFRELQTRHPVDELALVQWRRCVDAARRDLACLPQHQVYEIVYEDFVRHPAEQLAGILTFLGRQETGTASAVKHVSASSVGRGRQALGTDATLRLTSLGQPTLRELGYA